MITVGLAGWGTAGRYFHTPFLTKERGFDLRYVVTGQAGAPGQQLSAYEALLDKDDVDLIVIATPHFLHLEQAVAALQAGKHVIVEKPVASTAEEVDWLSRVAFESQRQCIPFQNRRWDGDFLTLQSLLQAHHLGDVYHVESRWPYYRPTVRDRWKSQPDKMGGVFYDFAPHLIDQMILLFGVPQAVSARLAIVHPRRQVDDFFQIHLHFRNGLVTLLEVDSMNPVKRPRFHLRGTLRAYEKYGTDPQEDLLRAGKIPDDESWGEEDKTRWGYLLGDDGLHRVVRTLPGDYGAFYRHVHDTIVDHIPPPVALDDIALQLEIMDAARQSAQTGQVVAV